MINADIPVTRKKVIFVMPVLDDWQAMVQLIEVIHNTEKIKNIDKLFLAVDDGSQNAYEPEKMPVPAGAELHILPLKANQGHQRAIALGLAYVRRYFEFDGIIVLDADGEDRPEDISTLMHEESIYKDHIIVARRAQRSEGIAFRLFYRIYKAVFRTLTGRTMNFGNFSYIPAKRLDSIVFNNTVWNNYAATVLRSRAPIRLVPVMRGRRYSGSSRLNFTSLMLHGLSAISVFSDFVIGRIIMLLTAMTCFISASILSVLFVRLTMGVLFGFAAPVILVLSAILINAMFIGLVIIMMLLNSRNLKSALPDELLDHLATTPAKRYSITGP